MTRSLSNVIKAYTVRYKEEMRKIDISGREEEIHAKVADAIVSNVFVGGLNAVSLTESGEIPAIADYEDDAAGIPLPHYLPTGQARVPKAAERFPKRN